MIMVTPGYEVCDVCGENRYIYNISGKNNFKLCERCIPAVLNAVALVGYEPEKSHSRPRLMSPDSKYAIKGKAVAV